MANPTMDILDIVRKRLGEDETNFLQDALSAFLHALMEAEVNTQAGARLRRPFAGAGQPAQRLPRPPLGYPCRHARPCDPAPAHGQLLPHLPGATAPQRAGPPGRHPAGLRRSRVGPRRWVDPASVSRNPSASFGQTRGWTIVGEPLRMRPCRATSAPDRRPPKYRAERQTAPSVTLPSTLSSSLLFTWPVSFMLALPRFDGTLPNLLTGVHGRRSCTKGSSVCAR